MTLRAELVQRSKELKGDTRKMREIIAAISGIDELEKHEIMPPTPENLNALLNEIAEKHSIPLALVKKGVRKIEYVAAREDFCKEAMRRFIISAESIGEFLGYRDHSAVRHLLNGRPKQLKRL